MTSSSCEWLYNFLKSYALQLLIGFSLTFLSKFDLFAFIYSTAEAKQEKWLKENVLTSTIINLIEAHPVVDI